MASASTVACMVARSLWCPARWDRVVDVSGDGRMVLKSSNWKICQQEPAPGARLKAGKEALIGVVKWEEGCP